MRRTLSHKQKFKPELNPQHWYRGRLYTCNKDMCTTLKMYCVNFRRVHRYARKSAKSAKIHSLIGNVLILQYHYDLSYIQAQCSHDTRDRQEEYNSYCRTELCPINIEFFRFYFYSILSTDLYRCLMCVRPTKNCKRILACWLLYLMSPVHCLSRLADGSDFSFEG